MSEGINRRWMEDSFDLPEDRSIEILDVRSLGPPEPLVQTLERLDSLSPTAVLIQRNDRVPRFLFPELTARGFHYDVVETSNEAITAIWRT